MRVFALGQTLMTKDIRVFYPDSFAEMKELISGADAVFSNLEPALMMPGVGGITRKDGSPTHGAGVDVLDAIKEMGINFLSAASNHTWDYGTESLVLSMDELKKRGLVFSGIGANRFEAAKAGTKNILDVPVSIVSMATGKIREGGAALANRAGVNELRIESGVLNSEDCALNLNVVKEANSPRGLVAVVHHNHCWEEDKSKTPAWLIDWAHRCIDSGADIFIGHGAPLLQGLELYHGKPIFYNLGSFVFNCSKKEKWADEAYWQSIAAECSFSEQGELDGIELIPIVLDRDNDVFGYPRIARGEQAHKILSNFKRREF